MSVYAYRLFRAGWRMADWAARRFTPSGLLVLAVLVLGAVAGADTQTSLAYQLFAVAFGLMAVAAACAWRKPRNVSVRRQVPRVVTAGVPVRYSLTVHNADARPITGLQVMDRVADPRPSREQYRASLTGRARWSTLAAARRWQDLINDRSVRGLAMVDVPMLGPGQRERVDVQFTPARRGRVNLAGLWLARTEPLGLMRALAFEAQPESVLVLPQRFALPPLNLPGVRVHQPGGVTLASGVGDSEEFQGLRDYRPGDPLQHIHWKSFARTGRPIVKEFETEFFERHALVLDTSTGGPGEALETAVSVAASFAYTVDTQESLLDLLFVGERSYCFTAGRGQLHSNVLLEVLAQVEPTAQSEFTALANTVLGRRHAFSSCILIFSSWDDAREQLVTALRGSGLAVMALWVDDVHDDASPSSAESASAIRLTPASAASALAGLASTPA